MLDGGTLIVNGNANVGTIITDSHSKGHSTSAGRTAVTGTL